MKNDGMNWKRKMIHGKRVSEIKNTESKEVERVKGMSDSGKRKIERERWKRGNQRKRGQRKG